MPQLAAHIGSVPSSGIRVIYEIAADLDGIISLGVGEPDLAVAPHIAAAAHAAWDAGETHYTANGGIAPLRRAIIEKLARENDLDVDVDQIWVTVGATQALHQAMAITLSPGDEVLVPDPGYTTFTMNARMLGAEPVPYSLLPSKGFMPDIAELERLVTPKTRLIIVNSPSNPLGVVFPEATLLELLGFAKRHDLWLISDEVYERFTYGERHVSVASLDDDNRVFTTFSLSKTYAMTGIRIGYLVTPPGIEVTMRAVQEATISCVNSPAQYAAIAAITGDQSHVDVASRHYRDNLEAGAALLDSMGIRYLAPRGAFYLWIDLAHATNGDVAAWAKQFLVEKRVAVAPGSAFGASGEGWIRVCLAATRADLLDGLARLPHPA